MFFAMTAQGILNSYKVFSFPSAAEAAQKLAWVGGIFAAMLYISRKGQTETLGPHVVGAAFLFGCYVQSAILLWGLRGRMRLYRLRLPLLSYSRLAQEIIWLAVAIGLASGAWFMLRDVADAGSRSFWTISAFLGAGCLYGATLWLRTRGADGAIERMMCLAAPLLIGVLFARYRDLALASFQTYAEEGGFTMIEMAKRVANVPNMLVAYPLSIAILPFLCDIAAQRDTKQMSRLVGGSVRMLSAALLPLTAVTIVMSGPVMRLLFDHRAAWSAGDVRMAGLALAILSTSILFVSLENILMQTFFSLQRTILPTVLGIIFSVLPSLALYLAIEKLEMGAHAFLLVCIAWPAARILKNLFLFTFVQRRVPVLAAGESAVFLPKLAALCAAPALAAWATYRWIAAALPLEAHSASRVGFELVKCIHVGVPSLCALLAFLLLCVLLRLEEFRVAVQWVREKGWRHRPAASSESVSAE